MVVARVTRFETGWHSLGTDAIEIFLQQRHVQAPPPVLLPGARQAEVVVWFVSRVGFTETAKELRMDTVSKPVVRKTQG